MKKQLNLNKILTTIFENGEFSLCIRRHEFAIFHDDVIIKRFKTSKKTLQFMFELYYSIIKENKTRIIKNTVQSGVGYISIGLDKISTKKMDNCFESLGIKDRLKKDDFHFTLFYDKSNPIINPEELERNVLLNAKAVDIEVLGDNNAIAIIFESEELLARFKYLESIGFVHDFEKLIPHCTIQYNPTKENVDFIKSKKEEIIKVINTISLKKEQWRFAI